MNSLSLVICDKLKLPQGRLLASGPVGELLSNDTIVEISAEDMDQLRTALRDIPPIKSMTDMEEWIECLIDDKMKVADFGRLIFEKGIVPTRFVARKRRLEEEFLEITKNA